MENTKTPPPAPDKNTEAKVVAIDFAEPLSRDAPVDAAFDIVISFVEANGESHTWRGEVSKNYGTGNNATKTRAQITLDALSKIGFTNPDLSQIENDLMGKIVPITVKYSYSDTKGQWYKNVFLGHGGIRRIDKAKALNIMRMVGGITAPSAFGSAQTPPPPPSPFAFK